MDISVDGLAPMSAMDQRREQFGEAVEYAVSLGARVAEHQPEAERGVVMLDPAGHPFRVRLLQRLEFEHNTRR